MRHLSLQRLIAGLTISAGCLVVGVILGIVADVPGLASGSAFHSAVVPLAVALAASSFTTRAIGMRGSPSRKLYTMVAVALWLSAISSAMNVIQPATKYPAPADYVNVGVYAVASLATLFSTTRRSVTHMLDGLVFASSLMFVTWGIVFAPVLEAFHGNFSASLASLTGPACDCVLLSALLVTARRGTSNYPTPMLGLFGAAISFDAVGGVSWAYHELSQPQPGLTVLCWTATGVFYASATLYTPRVETPPPRPATLAYMLFPYVPAAVAVVAGVATVFAHTRLPAVAYAPAVVAVASVVVRQLFALLDNIEMAKRLEVSHTKLMAREEQLNSLAYRDPLTQLANRRYFDERVAAITADPTTEFVIMLLDVDDFKRVNDTYGHEVGDGLLVAIAETLVAHTRGTDIVARLGGDEFAIMLPNISNDVAIAIAERIASSFDVPTSVGVQSVDVGVSIGLARSEASASVGTILRQADMAMYRRKGVEGKGGVAVFASI